MFGVVQCPISGDVPRMSQRAQVVAPVALEAESAKETSKAASRRSSETAIAAKAFSKAVSLCSGAELLGCWAMKILEWSLLTRDEYGGFNMSLTILNHAKKKSWVLTI